MKTALARRYRQVFGSGRSRPGRHVAPAPPGQRRHRRRPVLAELSDPSRRQAGLGVLQLLSGVAVLIYLR